MSFVYMMLYDVENFAIIKKNFRENGVFGIIVFSCRHHNSETHQMQKSNVKQQKTKMHSYNKRERIYTRYREQNREKNEKKNSSLCI